MSVTTCRGCRRVVYAAHVNPDGYCCFCEAVAPPAPQTPAPAYEIRWQEFTTLLAPDVKGWFHHADLMLAMLTAEQPLLAVELGSYRGASAIPQARTLAEWGGRLVCVDPWRDFPGSYEQIQQNVARYGLTNVDLWRMRSVEAAHRWPEAEVERPAWIYVDGDHSDAGVQADLEAWWPLLAEGGLILGDDYGNPDYPGVARAWHRFGADKDLHTERGRHTWGLVWIRKGPSPAAETVHTELAQAAA